jgi:hypothetical protein
LVLFYERNRAWNNLCCACMVHSLTNVALLTVLPLGGFLRSLPMLWCLRRRTAAVQPQPTLQHLAAQSLLQVPLQRLPRPALVVMLQQAS